MIHARRPRTPTLACLSVGLLLGACAEGVPAPVQSADAPRYTCPDGTRFTTQPDSAIGLTDLFVGGRVHRLSPIEDPLGGTVFQDADYQLRTAPGDAFSLTDRSSTVRQVCPHAP
jgi:hypothetical protein